MNINGCLPRLPRVAPTPVHMEGGQAGYPMDLDVRPHDDGTTDITGHLHGYGTDMHITPTARGAHVDGHEAGFGLDLDITRTGPGQIHIEGHQSGAPLGLDMQVQGDSLSAQGGAHHFPAGFTLTERNGVINVQGGQNGFPMGYDVTPQPDGSLSFKGGEDGFPLGMTMTSAQGPLAVSQVGDFFPHFSPAERAALFHVLLG